MNENRLLDVEYIQNVLDEGYHYTQETQGRDLVVVLGNTGVGKSTTCNYLLGYRMKESIYKGRPVVDTVDETNIKIGHEVNSETLYAKSFVVDIDGNSGTADKGKGNNNLCLLDCPGFFGNRTVEDKVIESISTELAIRSARQVKGILILISLNVLMETRVKELRELMKTLISLFKDPLEMVHYSVFAITKKYKHMPYDQAKSIAIGALSSLKDYCKKQATKFRENPNLKSCDDLTCIDYDRIATYFSEVLKKKDDIIFIDPLDKGSSRKLIFDQIENIKPRRGNVNQFTETVTEGYIKISAGSESEPLRPVTINDFCFSEGNEDRVKFYKALYDRAREGINFISEILRCSEKNKKLFSEISNCQTRLSTLETLERSLEDEICKADEGKSQLSKIDFESVKVLKSMIVENDKKIKSKTKELKESELKKEKLNEELKKINIDAPMLFIEKSINRHVAWWKLFGWEKMDFVAETSEDGIEIIKVEKEMRNGYWENEVDEREKGIYKITYVSKYHARPAKASVKTYIKTKDAAGNKISIEKKEAAVHDYMKQEIRLKSEIDILNSENQALHATVTQANINKEDYIKNLKQKLEDCKKDIQRLNANMDKMHKDREQAKVLGMTYLQEFLGNHHKYDVTINISNVLELSSGLIKNFTSQYNEFLSFVDNYTSCFDENDDKVLFADNKESDAEEERIFGLKDPFTGNEIKDLVVTTAGTVFDEHSLLKQFDISLENPSPFVYEREDGSTEKIEFLSWQKIPDIQNYIDRLRNEKLNHSTSSGATYIGSENLSLEELEQQKNELSKDIQKMKDEIEMKETDLEKIANHCEKLQSETAVKEISPNTSVLEDSE